MLNNEKMPQQFLTFNWLLGQDGYYLNFIKYFYNSDQYDILKQ